MNVRDDFGRMLDEAKSRGRVGVRESLVELVKGVQYWDELVILWEVMDDVLLSTGAAGARAVWKKREDGWELSPSVDCPGEIAFVKWDAIEGAWVYRLARGQFGKLAMPDGEDTAATARRAVVDTMKAFGWPGSWLPESGS